MYSNILSGAHNIVCYAFEAVIFYPAVCLLCNDTNIMVVQSYDRSHSRLCIVDRQGELNFMFSCLPQG